MRTLLQLPYSHRHLYERLEWDWEVMPRQTELRVHFRVRRRTQFRKVFDVFLSKFGLASDEGNWRFEWQGRVVQWDDSMQTLNMPDGCQLDAVNESEDGTMDTISFEAER